MAVNNALIQIKFDTDAKAFIDNFALYTEPKTKTEADSPNNMSQGQVVRMHDTMIVSGTIPNNSACVPSVLEIFWI